MRFFLKTICVSFTVERRGKKGMKKGEEKERKKEVKEGDEKMAE